MLEFGDIRPGIEKQCRKNSEMKPVIDYEVFVRDIRWYVYREFFCERSSFLADEFGYGGSS
jgi:hypothetical protein